MGIKGTDDYLTIRFANPTTGEVSPSACGFNSPRTPATPGEALLLYTDSSPVRRPVQRNPVRVQNIRPLRNPRYRWKQNQGRWLANAVAASPKMTISDELSTCEEQSEGGEDIDRSSSIAPSQPLPLQKTFSIGAGPRKFAAASQALKDVGKAERPRLHRRVTAIRKAPLVDVGQLIDDTNQQSKKTEAEDLLNDMQVPYRTDNATTHGTQPVTAVMANHKISRSSPATSAAQKAAKVTRKPEIPPPPEPFQYGSVTSIRDTTEQDVQGGPRDQIQAVPGAVVLAREETAPSRVRARPANIRTKPISVPVPDPTPEISQQSTRAPAQPATTSDRQCSGSKQFVMVVEALLQALRPHIRVDSLFAILPAIDVLLSKETPSEERMKALKDLLPGIGQIVLLFTLFSILWKVVATIKELIDIALWPLTVVRGCMRFLLRY
ncbi:hypothetical protein MBLNU457_3520t1 [Dothideomycetes sp. NU457]